MNNTEDKLEITELMNKLFIHTDYRDWDKLKSEVFTEEIEFDMTSAGGPASILSAEAIFKMWDDGFSNLDGVHHQGGHYLISIENNMANIFAYALALHFKNGAKEGNTRIFAGSYDVKAIRTPAGWRLNAFRYNLKFIGGNAKLA